MTHNDGYSPKVSRRRALIGGGAVGALALAGPRAAWANSAYAMGDMTIGDANAPVRIIEYASMTCPHCASFHNNTYPELKAKYIDTGKVHMTFRTLAFDRLGLYASMLPRCTGTKRYFAIVDLLFRQQPNWLRSQQPVNVMQTLAAQAGLSRSKFETCLNDRGLADEVLRIQLEGRKEHDVQSTPTFVINGDLHSGALSFAEFEKILAKHLPDA